MTNNEDPMQALNNSYETPFSTLEKDMKEKGFVFVGTEMLTKYEFKDGAKFEVVADRTKEDVIAGYVKHYKDQVEIEVELVDKTDLSENQNGVYVFIKPKK